MISDCLSDYLHASKRYTLEPYTPEQRELILDVQQRAEALLLILDTPTMRMKEEESAE